jgi:pimeloyl-ACP methyl ester carboxylesterase
MTDRSPVTATYVLVHGGGHGGWCYRKVARLLRAAGHEVHAPALTGLGERSHLLDRDIDLDDRLTGHPWRCFEQKLELTNEHALWAIPQYHVVCTSTLATRDPELMGQARSEARLWDIDTGHDLMITEPEQVADALLEIAAR